MKARPTLATLSASGTAKPLFMHSDPNKLYQMLFGSIAGGDVNKKYKARSKVLLQVESLASSKGKNLPSGEKVRYANYVNGFKDMNGLREKLSKVSSQLKKHAPKYELFPKYNKQNNFVNNISRWYCKYCRSIKH